MNKRDDQSPRTHWEAVVATLFVRRKALGPHTHRSQTPGRASHAMPAYDLVVWKMSPLFDLNFWLI